MKFTKKKRTENYLAVLNYVYEHRIIGDTICEQFRTSRSLPYYMQELGWINMKNKKVEWLLPHPPTKATAIHLMDFATARTNQYNAKARAKRNQEVSEIKFDEKQELKPEAEERFTWGEWLERLKNNPIYEYRLTRVKRSTEPEVIL